MEENHEDWDHHCHIFVSLSTSLVMSSAAHAATSPAMQACSKQWADMKAAGQSAGQTWPHFWSQCSKEAAAKNGSDLLMSRSAKTDKESPKPVRTAGNDDAGATSAAQKKDCDAKRDSSKTKSGSHGWHDYFQFMSHCM